MFRKLFSGSALALATAGLSFAQAPRDRDDLSPAARAALNNFNPPDFVPGATPVWQLNGELPADIDRPGNGEVLISGPLHEAFAEQFTNQPRPGFIVTKEPPAPVDEIPPEYRPDGYDIVWIPGYWGWDPERDNFVWVTGIWRQAPPDRNWVPGYWTQVTEGFQWISGFWAPTSVSEIEYLPKPPEPIEAGPSSEPPSANHFWIPGQWAYNNGNYQWRAGYWAEGYEDWVWVPDRYVWTPGGYIYRTGYWDYLLSDRGTIFCPVYWSTPQPNYRFQPNYVVNSGPGLLANLFVNPAYNHYYYGNYYGNQYASRSIYPWVTFTQQSQLYDPLYGYYRTQYRDAAFLARVTRMHNYYAANPTSQPARTLAAQIESGVLANAAGINNFNLNNSSLQAVRLTSLLNNQDSPLQLVQLGEQERRALESGISPARELRQLRQRSEKQQSSGSTNNADGGNIADASQRNGTDRRGSNRWKLPETNAGSRLGSVAVTPGNVTPNVDGSQRNNDTSNSRDGSVRGNTGRNDGDRDVARGDSNRDRAQTDGNRDSASTDGNRDSKRADTNNDSKSSANANSNADTRGGRPNDNNPASANRDNNRTPAERDGDERTGRRNPDAKSPENPFGTSGLPGVTRPDQPPKNLPDLGDVPNRPGANPLDPNRANDDKGRTQPPRNLPDLGDVPNRPGANPLNPNRTNDDKGRTQPPRDLPDLDDVPNRAGSNRPGIAPGEPNPGTPGRGTNRPSTQGQSPDANGRGNAITDPAVREDMRAMQELSRREIERRRSNTAERRPLPQIPGSGTSGLRAPNSVVPGAAPNNRTPGATSPAPGAPGSSNPGSGARTNPTPNRPNVGRPDAKQPGAGVNPAGAVPRLGNPAADPSKALNPGALNPGALNPGAKSPGTTNPGNNQGARTSQRPVLPTPAANVLPGRAPTQVAKPSNAKPGRAAGDSGRSRGNNKDNKGEKEKKN